MKWKKLLCLAAAALMLVGIFGGCGKKNDSSSGGDSSYTASADEGIFSREKVNWYDDAGDVRYKIVRPLFRHICSSRSRPSLGTSRILWTARTAPTLTKYL